MKISNTISVFLAWGSILVAPSAVYGQRTWETLTIGYEPSFGKLRDTLFVLDSTYLEVRLDQQMIYQRFRSGRVDRYLCSTGNPRIPDGIATREGIFAVKSKAKKTLSQQFNVYLNYWIGFDGGIGLHGLDSRSYYRHLGRRPSSHGCVRISNETGSRLFGSVPNGTIVYVHSGAAARVVAFADSALPGLSIMNAIDNDLLKQRIDAVVAGDWADSSLTFRLAVPPRFRFPGRISVGRVDPKLVIQRPIELLDVDRSPLTARTEAIASIPQIPLIPLTNENDNEGNQQISRQERPEG